MPASGGPNTSRTQRITTIGSITKLISEAIHDNALLMAWLALLSVVAVVIITIEKTKSKTRYRYWKKDVINLGIFSREWERTDDDVLRQLFDENARLEAENKLLKKQYSRLSLAVVAGLVILIVSAWVSQKYTFIKARFRSRKIDPRKPPQPPSTVR